MKIKLILPIIFLILVTTTLASYPEEGAEKVWPEEDIPLGKGIADSTNDGFDWNIDNSDLESFQDTKIDFQKEDYDTHEGLILKTKYDNGPSVETSLTAGDDDYETNVFMHVGRKGMYYYYSFDDAIIPSNATPEQPLTINFLGKTLRITNVDTSKTMYTGTTTVSSKFTAYVGNEYLMHVSDTITVEGKRITLENVGSGGSIIIDVEGIEETIPAKTAETVNGIEIYNDDTFYADSISQRIANLFIGNPAVGTFEDGEAYIGQAEANPDWKWYIKNLYVDKAYPTVVNQTMDGINYQGPIIGLYNNMMINSDDDNPPGIGECLNLPNNYASICLDSLTVLDEDYLTLTIEYKDNVDLSSVGLSTSEKTIHISAPGEDRFTLIKEGENTDYTEYLMNVGNSVTVNGKTVTLSNVGSSGSIVVDVDGTIEPILTGITEIVNEIEITNLETYYEDTKSERSARFGVRDTVILTTTTYTNTSEIWATMINETEFGIYYRNNEQTPNIVYFGNFLDGGKINYEDTILNFGLEKPELGSQIFFNINSEEQQENLIASFSVLNGEIQSLGNTALLAEATELGWFIGNNTATGIGVKDEDHRTAYGIIIKDPKSNGAVDKVVLEIPRGQVRAKVMIEINYIPPEEPEEPGYNINLDLGWNLFSIPLTQNDTKVETVINDIKDNVEVIYSYNQGNWKVWRNNYPSNTLTNLEAGKGYFLKVNEHAVLHLEGTIGAGEPPTIPTFNVYTGWNLIGPYGTEDTSVLTYLRNIENKYSAIWTLFKEDTQSLQGILRGLYFNEQLKRTHGYWIYLKEGGVIVPTN